VRLRRFKNLAGGASLVVRSLLARSVSIGFSCLGQTEEAIEHIHNALELDPDFADAHNMLGIILARTGKVDEGIAHLQRAVALIPESPEYHFNFCRLLAAGRRFPDAVPECEKAVELWQGNEPQSLKMLAAMYSEVGRFPDAAQTARRALAIASGQNDQSLAQELRGKIAYYDSQAGAAPAPQ
jgi:Flp pilus assembly protein TadD